MKSNDSRAMVLLTRAIAAIATSITVLAAVSCDSIDLTKLSVRLWPNDDGTVIKQDDTVSVDFSENVRHEDAEAVTTLKSASVSVEHDVTWAGRRMTITPTKGWRAGAAYTLRCKGTVSADDGRTFEIDDTVTFFAVTSAAPPTLTGQEPANDAIVSKVKPIELTFSKPLNPSMIDRYVTISPSHELSVTLSADGKTLTVSPRNTWEGLTRYQWTVLKELAGSDGVPIKEEYRGSFRAQEDIIPPGKPTISAVDVDNPSLEAPLTAVRKRSGLLFRFPDDVAPDSFAKQLEIMPDSAMKVRRINERSFLAYQDDADWISGTEYSISIKKGLVDTNGNETTEDYSYTFTPPYLPIRIESIANSPPGSNAAFEGAELASSGPLSIAVNALTLDHDFVIEFSEPLSDAETARLTENLTIKRVFPLSVADPSIVSLIHLAEGKVNAHIINLAIPKDESNGERVIYKLTIKGGTTGFTLDAGNILEKDFSLYLESVSP